MTIVVVFYLILTIVVIIIHDVKASFPVILRFNNILTAALLVAPLYGRIEG